MRWLLVSLVVLGLVGLVFLAPQGAELRTVHAAEASLETSQGLLVARKSAAAGFGGERAALVPNPVGSGREGHALSLSTLERLEGALVRGLGKSYDREWVEGALGSSNAELERDLSGLVLDLLDDGVRGNATSAAFRLGLLGKDAAPALRGGLATADDQQRRYVVSLLLQADSELAPALLRAAYRNLEDDRWRWGRDDTEAVTALIRGGEASWEVVAPGLHSMDTQQRFLSAIVLAHTRCPHHAELVVTVLVGHLRDNQWSGDAGQASRALYALGELARPHLERLRGTPGHQVRRLIALVLSELEAPSGSARGAYKRAQQLAPGPDGRPLTVWRFQEDRAFGLQ